ncbi:MAG: phosphoesterase [Alphaproteobacteria bacterium]|nr:phosphoesterase [Alphaproteobacteria bacterium]
MTIHFRHPTLALILASAACASSPAISTVTASAASEAESAEAGDGRAWLAGDHHIHSRFSADYEPDAANPGAAPVPILGVDGVYPIPTNAAMARKFGLSWMVSTDHGGPNHSKLNHDQAYPELEQSRASVPEVIQFYGMEFDTPGGDHSSLIIPHTQDERESLRRIESGFSKREAFPSDASRDTEPKMIEALTYMKEIEAPPVVIANHPSRSATAVGAYGQYDPAEFRDWNDAAPEIAVGMEGAPGHQAAALNADGTLDPKGARGGYGRSPTMGGFDQMTARLGGFWDSMLGEGRRWWVTSTSDSHRHVSEGGSDFWPGEYSKTYVHARPKHDDILDGLRRGRVFVATGGLVSELDVAIDSAGETARIGGELTFRAGADIRVTIRVRDPAGVNSAGRTPAVERIDLIVGDVTGPRPDRDGDRNPTTRIAKRFTAADWTRAGEVLTMIHVLPAMAGPGYVRVRGTSTAELEPSPDPLGEDPWSDLWFYSNPVFLRPR